ncbi:MAG: hypothetical protein COB60_05685 [Flavobacteriaceae bacterium]|nr:MAG: hypothetical protein COB60_05685 [Flavobacteriaceae bacterium]
MKAVKNIIRITLLLIALISTQHMEAQKRSGKESNRAKEQRSYDYKPNHRQGDRYRTQPIRRNPHYRYPQHRRVVRTLHHNHLRFVFGGLSYFYYSGVYYTAYGNEYLVVVPPRGFRVAVLPVGHVRIMVGPVPYFYHSGIYYVESNDVNSNEQYEITQPPIGAVITDISEDADQIIMDGNVLYEYNDVFYKRIDNENGSPTYKVVYSKNNNDY